MTRNAVVVSPHPLARRVSIDACRTLQDAAAACGRPARCDPDRGRALDPADRGTDGGRAYQCHRGHRRDRRRARGLPERHTRRSGSVRATRPWSSTGPPTPPWRRATSSTSKAFDNSLLCSAESVLIADAPIAGRADRGAQAQRRAHLQPAGGRPAARLPVPGRPSEPGRRGQGAPLSWPRRPASGPPRGPGCWLRPDPALIPEEHLASEKMSPVLGLQRPAGSWRSHSRCSRRPADRGGRPLRGDPQRRSRHVIAFAQAVDVLRVVVNAPNSTGVAGFDTNLAPTMTVGTGFTGRSSLGENLAPRAPRQLVPGRLQQGPPAFRSRTTARLRPWERQPEARHSPRA